MEFYVIRHGQSENNLLYLQTGSLDERNEDPELTDLGRRQAERLAEYLSRGWGKAEGPKRGYDPHNRTGFGLTHLYCSLMVRSVATGLVVAKALGLPLVAWRDVHETGGIHCPDPETGEHVGLPGKDRRYFEATYPDLVLGDWPGDGGWWNRPYEAREERAERAKRFLAELLARHGGTDDRVAVVTHGGFYNTLMAQILGRSREASTWFAFENTAITRIDFGAEVSFVQYTNRVDHLPAEIIT